MEELQGGVKPVCFTRTVLEMPEVIISVPRVFSLIMVRDSIQGPSVLATISRDNTDDMWVGAHGDPSIPCQDSPPPVVSYDAGNKVGPRVEIEA